MAIIRCNGCGAQVDDQQNFCAYCGNKVVLPEPKIQNNEQTVQVNSLFGEGGGFDTLFGSINKMMESQGLDTIDFGNVNMSQSSGQVTTITTTSDGKTVTKTVTSNNSD